MDLDFSGLIREGDRVVCGQATAEPVTLTEALVAQAGHLPAFRMMVGPIFSDTFSAACAPNVSFQSYGVIGNARRLAKAGRLDVIPSNYSAFCADFASRRHRADVVLVQLAEVRRWPLERKPLQRLCHRCRAGHARRHRRDQSGCAFDVSARNGPGRADPFAGRRPAVRRSNWPPPPLDDVSRQIAAHAASLIADGSTLSSASAAFRTRSCPRSPMRAISASIPA